MWQQKCLNIKLCEKLLISGFVFIIRKFWFLSLISRLTLNKWMTIIRKRRYLGKNWESLAFCGKNTRIWENSRSYLCFMVLMCPSEQYTDIFSGRFRQDELLTENRVLVVTTAKSLISKSWKSGKFLVTTPELVTKNAPANWEWAREQLVEFWKSVE